jgi:tRNA threonylcarbamoyladenosine biosynthesis protein TsaB
MDYSTPNTERRLGIEMADAEPLLLLIETSGRVGRVGLALGSQVLSARELDKGRRHARDLAPATAGLFADCGLRPRDLTGVVVSLGPGSYTGLRVGVMTAKTLAYATGCALIGVPTFHVLAGQAETATLELVAIADAQQEKLYLQEFGRATAVEPFVPAGELRVVPGREWARQHRGDVTVTGPGLRIAEDWLPEGTPRAPPAARESSIAGLLAVGWQWYRRGVRDDPFRLEPLYLRPSSAEEQWHRRADSRITG